MGWYGSMWSIGSSSNQTFAEVPQRAEVFGLRMTAILIPTEYAIRRTPYRFVQWNGGATLATVTVPPMSGTAKETRKRFSARMDPVDARDVSALAAIVQRLVNESGDPVGFDALVWTKCWLHRPAAALGGLCPAEYMTTPEGRALVEQLIMRMQSGAYS